MSIIEMPAQSRIETGKGIARKLRQSGVVPASVYRAGEVPTLITVDPMKLTLAFEKTGNPNSLVNLTVDGKTFQCLVKEVQRHPVSGLIRHVDFYEVKNDESIVVEVPVRTTGRAAGVAMGGALRLIRRELSVKCLPQDIPSHIDVDVTSVQIGKFIKVNQVPSPENVEIMFDSKGIFNVVTVVKRRGAKK